MNIEIHDDAGAVALRAASVIAGEARKCVALRGSFILAVSGGKTPWQMLRFLAAEDVPWESIHILQVDERFAPDGHTDRNLTHLLESLTENPRSLSAKIHAMPVGETDIKEAGASYAETIRKIAGANSKIDLVHLGLGTDGHTASLIPGDPVLDITDKDVAVTGIYQGRRRLTLTYPLINRAGKILWVVTGGEKKEMLQRLISADSAIPAGRISQENAMILTDIDSLKQLV
jgi:6-phosphogluconolactonase